MRAIPLRPCLPKVVADAVRVCTSLAKILSAYTTSHRFSLDLPQAVLRQGDFVDKMFELGWTAPGRFNVDATDLYRSIIRYHACVASFSRFAAFH